MTNKDSKKINFNNTSPVAYVIGGAGFIGSYVCESLCAQNLNVISLDDLSTGKEDNLAKLKALPNFKSIVTDINNGFSEEWPKPDYIFHIGGIEAYIDGQDLSLNTMLVNSIGTYHTLEAAKKTKSKYLLVSSLDVYNGALSGLDLNRYFGLSDRDARRYTHHEAKRYAEALATEYFQKFDIDVRIVRVAEVFGPRMNISAGTEIANLFKDAIHTDTLHVLGDGLKLIYPVYISDVVVGITKAMFSKSTTGKIYNLATDQELNILNFAYAIQKNSTKPLKIQFSQEYKEIKFPSRKIELKQTKEELGWTGKTSIDEGITQTLEFLFLNKDTVASERPKEDVQKTAEIPYIPPVNKPNDLPEVKRSTDALTPKKEQTKSKSFNLLNGTILAISLFTILTLFAFPITALFYTSTQAIESAVESTKAQLGSKEQSEYIANAQKNVAFANTQFDNLEWFFSMLRQRSKFESSRSTLLVIDKYTRALSIIAQAKATEHELEKDLVNGVSNPEKRDENLRRRDQAVLLLENTLLENQAIGETLYTENETQNLSIIIDSTKKLLLETRVSAITTSNTYSLLTPAKEKNFAVVFLDNNILLKEGGKVIGFALIHTNDKGIQNVKVYKYEETTNNLINVAEKIKEAAEENKYGTVEAVVLANNDVQSKLVEALKTIPMDRYAEVLTAENIEAKRSSPNATTEYKTVIWDAIWNKLKTEKNYENINRILAEAIANEKVQILVSTDERVFYPQCMQPNLLKELFTNQAPQKDEAYYCIIPTIESAQGGKNIIVNQQVNAGLSKDDQKVSTTFSIENKETSAQKLKIAVQVPGKPKLTNVLAPFPVSFDKVKTTATDRSTQWEYEIDMAANGKNEIKFEWSANLSDGNIQANGLYIEKQFGANIQSITGKIENEENKSITKQSKNADLLLNFSE